MIIFILLFIWSAYGMQKDTTSLLTFARNAAIFDYPNLNDEIMADALQYIVFDQYMSDDLQNIIQKNLVDLRKKNIVSYEGICFYMVYKLDKIFPNINGNNFPDGLTPGYIPRSYYLKKNYGLSLSISKNKAKEICFESVKEWNDTPKKRKKIWSIAPKKTQKMGNHILKGR